METNNQHSQGNGVIFSVFLEGSKFKMIPIFLIRCFEGFLCGLVCGVFSVRVAADYAGCPQDVDKWWVPFLCCKLNVMCCV